jgi:Domain of unknown function (DUF4352)
MLAAIAASVVLAGCGSTTATQGSSGSSAAQADYINVLLSVKNTGNEAQSYFARDQHLIIKGNKFDAAPITGAPGDGDNINPGLGIAKTVVSFDVPVGAAPEAIELHDSVFSGGVKVSLAGSPAASNG